MKFGAIVYTSLPEVFAAGGRIKGGCHANVAPIMRAALRAGSDAIKAGRAESVRKIRERRAMKAGAVRDAITLQFPTSGEGGALLWSINVSSKPARVADYPYRQTRQGVSVQIKTSGRSLIRGAFVATMPKSGHTGVFYRTGEFGRRGNPKLEKIDEAFTTRVSDVFRDAGFIEAVLDRTKAVFRSTYARNVTLALGVKGEDVVVFGEVAR